MSINFLIAQTTFGQLVGEYPQMCKVNTQSHSFFASVGFSLLCQISRLQSTNHSANCLQQLDQYLNQILEFVGGEEYYINMIGDFRGYINYAKTNPASTYVPWITQVGGNTISYTLRLITILILKKKSHPEDSVLSDMASSPKDDLNILKMLSESLMVGINFYNYNTFVTIDENQLAVKPLLFIGKLSAEEYVSLSHLKFVDGSDTSLFLNDFPFVLVKQPVLYIGKVTSNIIPGDMQIPKIPKVQPIETPYSGLVKFIMQILFNRNWKFSKTQAKAIMPIVKSLLSNDFCKEEATKLYKILKSSECEHSFSSFFLFQCGKYHCKVCIREEIDLKQLMDYQVYCSCLQRVNQNEINYFFLENTKNSLQNCPLVQQHHDSPNENKFSQHEQTSPTPVLNKGVVHSGMPSGMNSGMPPGTIPGISTGMNSGLPSGFPTGINSGMPQGMSSVMPPAMPSGRSPAMPPGMPSGMPQGMPSGMPQGMPPGMPPVMTQAMSPGLPQGIPAFPGMPGFGSTPVDNNSLQGNISLPRVSFCTKCHVPIGPNEIDIRGGKPYHKLCKD